MARIQVESAQFSYLPNTPVFRDVTLEIHVGEIFCVVGPNGCGKTTLLDCMLGLHALDSGRILFHGKDSRELHPRDRAAMVAYVPQRHTAAFPYSVMDIVLMGRTYATRLFEAPSELDLEKARQALEKVGMSRFADRPYTQISGGELQLVLIARALAQQAGVIIMDEPTSHLDFRHELDVLEIISDLVKNDQLSIIMATHSLNQAFFLENAGIRTRVALMSDGRFLQVGAPSDVLNEQNLKTIFGLDTRVYTHENDGRPIKYVMALAHDRSGRED